MSQQWTDLQRYVIEEHFEDYTEGRISRRELLKGASLGALGLVASLYGWALEPQTEPEEGGHEPHPDQPHSGPGAAEVESEQKDEAEGEAREPAGVGAEESS